LKGARLLRPSEFSDSPLDTAGVTRNIAFPGIGRSFQVLFREVPRYLVRDPTLPLAVSSALWFSCHEVALQPHEAEEKQTCPSFTFLQRSSP
jgi:hypothetical protein